MARTIFIAAALALAVTLPAVPAQAAARTFVSAAGNDSNPCTITLPCRNLQAAYNAVAADGQVEALDPGNYGSLTITGPVSIQGHGWASMSATIGAAITITSPGLTDKITISGVVLDGLGITGTTGIQFNSGGTLIVRDSVVRNFSESGISLTPTSFTPNVATNIAVSNTMVANNGVHGIYLKPTGLIETRAVFNRVEAYANAQAGIALFGNLAVETRVTAVDCVAAHNVYGYYALDANSGSNAVFRVIRSTAYNNSTAGAAADTFARVLVSQSELEDNGDNWTAVGGGIMFTYGDNETDGEPLPASSASIGKK
jgi:hypothetical protein